jgi:translocation and assembly module TamA
VVGGKNLLTASLELERALFKDWGVAAFFDIGNAFNSLSNVRLYKGAGVGARYYTPIGALQLDVARQIGVDNPAFRIHFTVGFEL